MKKDGTNVPSFSQMLIFSEIMPVDDEGEPVQQLPPLQFEFEDLSMILHSSGRLYFGVYLNKC